MKLVFYGDSLTSGENNNFISFVDKLSEMGYDVTKIGVSGTTIGEYSLYPVDGFSLLNQLREEEFIGSDYVFLEYGLNDSAVVSVGKINTLIPLLELRKRIDFIRQKSPDTKIVFLSAGTIYHAFAAAQEAYLYHDYLKDIKQFLPECCATVASTYEIICKGAAAYCDYVCQMFKEGQYISPILDDDCLHPNDKGYKIIAENVSEFIVNMEKRKWR